MNKEQIEEISCTKCLHQFICCVFGNDVFVPCSCFEDKTGYRKQSEGEWQVCSDEYEICATEFVCSYCKESFCSSEMTDEQFFEMMKYCPNCGAKMKGGAE